MKRWFMIAILLMISFLNAQNFLDVNGRDVKIEKTIVVDGFKAIKLKNIDKPVKISGNLFIKMTDECFKKGRKECLKSLGCSEKKELFLRNWAVADCNEDPVKKAEQLKKIGFSARPELLVPIKLYGIEPMYLNDTYQSEQWNFHNTGNVTSADGKLSVRGNDHSHIQEAWRLLKLLGVADENTIGQDRKIGVIDDGFDIQHEDLKDNFLSWKNFSGPVEQDNMFSETVGITDNFHGTMVTGIAAARGNNSLGPSGVCPFCGIIGARMDADASFDPQLTPEQYLDSIFTWVYEQGAEVINCSWGPDAAINSEYFNELFSAFASEGREGLGTVVVFASGNAGEDFSWNPFATHPDTISVGATDSTGKRYNFSNYGEKLDIMAPTAGGEKSGTSTYYDRIWSTDNFLRPDCLEEGETPSNGCSDQAGWTPNSPVAGGDGWWGKYSFRFSHTSSAAPLVTGVIALMLEVNPELSAGEIKEILLVTADRVSTGDANYDEKGHSNKYGYGRVNALRAVAAAWIKGGGEISLQLKEDIDESSPCTKDECWDFEGIEFPDEEFEDDTEDDAADSGNIDADSGNMDEDIESSDEERDDQTDDRDNTQEVSDNEVQDNYEETDTEEADDKNEIPDNNKDEIEDNSKDPVEEQDDVQEESIGCSLLTI